jgi:iron(III) transport system substrate-binding protein
MGQDKSKGIEVVMRAVLSALILASSGMLVGCSEEPADLVIYSGRSESLVGEIIADFEESSGLKVEVRYGDTAEMTAQVLEEGDQSKADVFFSQDGGALGALSNEGILRELPEDLVSAVPIQYTSDSADWVGVSGRVRVVAYDPDLVAENDLPDDVLEFTQSKWRGKIGIAPTNASFQTFVTALRISEGEQATEDFLRGMISNDVQIYENNLAIFDAIEAGEVTAGLVNHYYLHELQQELGADQVRTKLKFLPPGTAGALVNVAGVGILKTSEHEDSALKFAEYLLAEETQANFVDITGEYPLVEGVEGPSGLPSLTDLGQGAGVPLGQLDSLEQTIELLTKVGLI